MAKGAQYCAPVVNCLIWRPRDFSLSAALPLGFRLSSFSQVFAALRGFFGWMLVPLVPPILSFPCNKKVFHPDSNFADLFCRCDEILTI